MTEGGSAESGSITYLLRPEHQDDVTRFRSLTACFGASLSDGVPEPDNQGGRRGDGLKFKSGQTPFRFEPGSGRKLIAMRVLVNRVCLAESQGKVP
jgi:hypothetical protein